MKQLSIFLSLLVVVLIFAKAPSAAIDVYEFETTEQEALFKELSNTLRCPKCQNNTIADSNSALAQDLRTKVYQMVKEGKSSDEIVDYMVARYGQFINYNPQLSPSTAILWFAPFIVIVFGVGFIMAKSRRQTVRTATPLDADQQARIAELLKEDETPIETRERDS
ncbi:cytochrome c-type biogenesis protein [Vibrio sp. RC27]